MDLKQIQELIRFVAKAGVSEVQLEQDDFKIVIKTGKGEMAAMQAPAPMVQMIPNVQAAPVVMPSAAEQPRTQAPASAEKADESKYETIKSPMIGTLYRRPGPDKEPFVKVGDTVSKGQVV